MQQSELRPGHTGSLHKSILCLGVLLLMVGVLILGSSQLAFTTGVVHCC
jgi:uncharacterized membrane protein HdeD (DUF308 family)